MTGYDELEVELPSRGDDRPGVSDLEEGVEVVVDDFDDDGDDEDEDDYPDDATDEDIDLVVALYREDGQPVAVALAPELANDLDELISQLRRVPGDGGAVGMVSIASEFFVVVRVRGQHVQLLLSDGAAATDWPIARDASDFLGLEVPDDEDEPGPVGDLDLFADSGLSDFELEAIASNYDEDSAILVEQVATKLNFGPEFTKVVAVSFE